MDKTYTPTEEHRRIARLIAAGWFVTEQNLAIAAKVAEYDRLAAK